MCIFASTPQYVLMAWCSKRFYSYIFTEHRTVVYSFLFGVPRSNLGPKTVCPEWNIMKLPSINVGPVTSNTLKPLSKNISRVQQASLYKLKYKNISLSDEVFQSGLFHASDVRTLKEKGGGESEMMMKSGRSRSGFCAT